LEVVAAPTPEPGPGEVLVRVKACGVCGSDLHMQEQTGDGYIAYGDHTRLPVVVGHEWSGVVETIGREVTTLQRGDVVCAETNNWCGVCTACRSGLPNQCANLEEIGFSIDGGFAEYVVVKERYCWKIDALSAAYSSAEQMFDVGALVEPCGVAYNALFIRGGGFLPGSNVVVFGAGPIGLACIALARAAGAAAVIAFDTVPERLALAEKLGASHGYDPVALARDGQDPAEVVLAATRGDGIAMAVEAAGASPRTFPIAERLLSPGGKIVQVGIGRGPTPVSLVRLQQQGVSLHGSMGNSGHGIYPNLIRLMGSGRLDLLPMVTARFPLDRALDAFAAAADRRGGKVLVIPA
jgi:threonine dehydrogenase-like Zn-dependent dehydrogenase